MENDIEMIIALAVAVFIAFCYAKTK